MAASLACRIGVWFCSLAHGHDVYAPNVAEADRPGDNGWLGRVTETTALDFHNPLVGKEEDWRLRGQEDYLQGATLLRKPYRAWSEDWEHDHCEFCWAKFMDPHFSPEHER